MPRFTFATGNLRKIMALPLYALGAAASALVRRQDDLWAVGCGIGVGEGALALAEHARSADPSLRIVWMARDAEDVAAARQRGLSAVRKDSWRGFRLTLRAGVVIVTHGFGDANRYGVRGAFVVQLWHGVPLKLLHVDSPQALRLPIVGRMPGAAAAMRWAYARAGRGIGMMTAASPTAARRLQSAFALSASRLAVTGDPRDDALFAPAERARQRLADLLHEPRVQEGRVILYAPTWRDGAPDPGVPDEQAWAGITGMLEETDSILLVRSHPLGAGVYDTRHPRVLPLPTGLVADVTPLLPAVDVLVTDYSSIAFDFALLHRPIVFFAPDAERYVRRHGLYEPYAQVTEGRHTTRWEAATRRLADLARDPEARARAQEQAARLARRFHTWQDGQNTGRTYRELRRRARGLPPQHTLQAPLPDDTLLLRTARIGDDGADLRLSGDVPAGGAEKPDSVSLIGPRARLDATVAIDGEAWQAVIPLQLARWSGEPLPPPSGRYRLALFSDGAEIPWNSAPGALSTAGRDHPGAFHAAWNPRAAALELSVPLAAGERGPHAQSRLWRDYRRRRPLEEAVFFESFYGHNASCNPRGIDRALARLRPDVTRYWSVADASVPVPDGGRAVIEGTAAWWRARARSRTLVVNDWLRKRYRARPGQSVLQTWHGTPLKRIALLKEGMRPRARVAVHLEQGRWDVMLAQNPFGADVLRKAYAFRGDIWQEGYPRDDILLDPGHGRAVRERLGVDPGTRLILYAPTWRDDSPGRVDHVHAAHFSRLLGDEYTILVRGHSRSLAPGSDVDAGPGGRVQDVTAYPDVSDLLAAADIVITDYSSIMFDATVTGKPLFFFAPDLDFYRTQLRGFTFDLLPVAPGPVLAEAHELAEAVRQADALKPEFAARYARWQARFNPRDDGRAGERVVRRMMRSGMI